MIGMDLDAGIVSAIGALVLAVLGILVKLLASTIKSHRDCMEEHADNRERVGGLTATVQYLSALQGPEAQRTVKETLAETEARIGSRKAEAAKPGTPAPAH